MIVSNPPYSAGQKSENDANKNTFHPLLHKNIEKTYIKESNAVYKRNLYDSYIKAIRWATDRIGNEGGVIGFVHNASIVNERSISGLRKSLVKEFDSIYCFNLRGNQRTKGELSKKEGGKVFGGSSRTPIAITFLVKHSEKQNKIAKIKYHDIGDYLNREEKLKIIKGFKSIKGIEKEGKWQNIVPDKYGDWVNQRDDSFYDFLPIGDKKGNKSNAIFSLHSLGVATNRDTWVYNFNKNQVKKNMENMIDFYNQELERLKDKELNLKNIDKFINLNKSKVKWSSTLKRHFINKRTGVFQKKHIRKSNYRPFTKSYLYFNNIFNDRVSQNSKIFPKENIENKVICVSGVGAKTFSVCMTDAIPDLQYLQNGQCFPLYWFDNQENKKDGITDSTLEKFKNSYNDKNITKEDIFYYIYALLHSKDYLSKYKDNFDKALPHIPMVQNFVTFKEIGKELADLHLGYENQSTPEGIKILKNKKEVNLYDLTPVELKVNKMRLNKKDKSKVEFNEHILITNIPKEVWDYKINGWSTPEWIINRYQCKVDKETRLENDPNTYSEDPAYVLKLLLSVITVSLKTKELVQNLPFIDFDKLTNAQNKAA